MNNIQRVITRFAPSPTGNLHIGGARTALFNWLFSKNQKGKFLLRIEDTDVQRSKDEYYEQIISTLKWLEINWDEEPYIQSKNIESHINIANTLLKNGYAYKCYCTEKELEEEKKIYLEKKIPYTYSKKCRNILEENNNKSFVVRFKSKVEGKTILKDLVQGNIEINNSTIEDFVILRKDNKPTYNLSAAVDDYQMQISHVIRGDDHKINAFKQIQIFESMKWKIPQYAHIPLIHSKEGKKLSKRDDASTVEDYKKIGILPEALRNYLLRLGWSYKDKEIFSAQESIELFSLKNIGKSPSKLDFERIKSINEYYIKSTKDEILLEKLIHYSELYKEKIPKQFHETIKINLSFLKNKSKSLEDIYNNSKYIFSYELNESEIQKIDKSKLTIIKNIHSLIKKNKDISKDYLKSIFDKIIETEKINFKDLGQPLRIILTGSEYGPAIYDIANSLGLDEFLKRLELFFSKMDKNIKN
ncbi:MAG: glutamate--tRNA ligase [Candidatus Fonsibacter lacus]|uniref:Glutamate--tRNA ligase n=1 Tax=Candidatus Fonsibacter lacus TaxID=2576439 RepID=A0A845SA58_9PROT|nr:glutamate--tRNA ligase [Candidatus Fonsibacter lacus]